MDILAHFAGHFNPTHYLTLTFEQPPFAISIRFEQKGNRSMTYVLEHTGLKVSHLYIFQAKQEYGIIERGIYLAEIRKRQVALMPI